MSKVVFLDTNIHLHYQPFEQIPWLELLAASSVTIVIPPVVIRELNKHKELHPHARVRRRAGAVLRKISGLIESPPGVHLPDGVSLLFEDRDPTLDFAAFQLSPTMQDDHLIASILMFRDEKPEAETILVTSDTGLMLIAKAKRHGISTLKLPDNLRLPAEPDPNQKRVRELAERVRELESMSPQVSLTLEDGKQHGTFLLPHPVELTEKEIESEARVIRQRYPKMKHRSRQTRGLPEHLASMEEAMAKSIAAYEGTLGTAVSAEDIDEYNAKLDGFYETYGRHLRNRLLYENLKRRTVELTVFVANDGTAPAEDLDVFMKFPDGFKLIYERDFPEPPMHPEAPAKPRSRMQKLYESLSMPPIPAYSSVPYISDPIALPSNVSAMSISRTDSYDVNFHVQRIKHNIQKAADPLYVVFHSFESAQSFHIDYRILAANIPQEETGQLHIIVKKD